MGQRLTDPFLQAMEAILEGRAEYAATLADLGFVPGDFVQHTRRGAPTAGAGMH